MYAIFLLFLATILGASEQSGQVFKVGGYQLSGVPAYVQEHVTKNSRAQGRLIMFLDASHVDQQKVIDFSGVNDCVTSVLRRDLLYEHEVDTELSLPEDAHATRNALFYGAVIAGVEYKLHTKHWSVTPASYAVVGALGGSYFHNQIFSSYRDGATRIHRLVSESKMSDSPVTENGYFQKYRYDSEKGNKSFALVIDHTTKALRVERYSNFKNCTTLKTGFLADIERERALRVLTENYEKDTPVVAVDDKTIELVAAVYQDALADVLKNKKQLPSLGFRYYWLQALRGAVWGSAAWFGADYFCGDAAPNLKYLVTGFVASTYLNNLFNPKVITTKRQLQFVKNLRESQANRNPVSLPNIGGAWFALWGNDTY